MLLVPVPLRALVLALALGTDAAAAAPVGPALDRPAIAVRAPARAVLIAAARAGSRLVGVGERGIVALSDDSGRTWRQAVVPTSVTLTAVRFADAKHGWAIGHGGVVLETGDGGEHWTRQLDGRRVAQIVLEAARLGGDAQSIKDAERIVTDGPDKPFLDLLVLDAQRVLVVGAYGLALASDDGGHTWTSWMPRLPNPKGLHLYAVRQRGQTLLLAGEQGLALLSDDGGRSFHRLEVPNKGSFFSAELLGERDLVLAGLRGNVLRSTDGGTNWGPIGTPMPVSIMATALAGDGSLLAVNQAGFMLGLQGDRLVPLNATQLPPLNGLLPLSGSEVLVMSVQGALSVSIKPGSAK